MQYAFWAGRGDNLSWNDAMERDPEFDDHSFVQWDFGWKWIAQARSKQDLVEAGLVELHNQRLAEHLAKYPCRSNAQVLRPEEIVGAVGEGHAHKFIDVQGVMYTPTDLDQRLNPMMPTVAKLPGGMGSWAKAQCTKASHDPNSVNGDAKRACQHSHEHWGIQEPDLTDVKYVVRQTYQPYGKLYMFCLIQVLRSWGHVKSRFPCPTTLPKHSVRSTVAELLKTQFKSACVPDQEASVQCYLSPALWRDNEWQREQIHRNASWSKECEVIACCRME